MAIVVHCACGVTYRMDDDKAGRKLRCRKCSDVIVIPAASPPPRATAGRPTGKPAAKASGGTSRDFSLDNEIELVLDDAGASNDELLALDLSDDAPEVSIELDAFEPPEPPDSAEFPALELGGPAERPSQQSQPPKPAKPEPLVAEKPRSTPPPETAIVSKDVLEVELDDEDDEEVEAGPPAAVKGGGKPRSGRDEVEESPFAFLEVDDEEEVEVTSRGGRSRSPSPRTPRKRNEDLEPESDESIEVLDVDDDAVLEDEDELPARANRKGAKPKAGVAGKRRSKRDDGDDDEDEDDGESLEADDEAEEESGAVWHNWVWAGGFAVAAIGAFFYLRWAAANGEAFTGEGRRRGVTALLAWLYSMGGEWAVSGFLLLVAGFFVWCGYTELVERREREARERRRKRMQSRR